MIEDLDDSTSEPSRRTHVAILSAASAAVALVLLYVLLVPASLMDTRQFAASPTPSPTTDSVVTFASGPSWVRSGQLPQIREVITMTPCFNVLGSKPPARLMMFDSNGQPMAYIGGTTEPPSSPNPDSWGEVIFIVSCDAPDASPPRIDRAR